MGITLFLKQVSVAILEQIKQHPYEVELFWGAKWLPESAFHSSAHRNQFVAEWETPDLDLHKYFPELTYLLAGYIPNPSERRLALPELRSRSDLMQVSAFMQFFIIENSEWDGLPLVNAIWAGTQIGDEETEWYQNPDEVGQILEGLRSISEEGFQARYQRESNSEKPCPWFEFDEEEEIEWLTAYYNRMVNYYQDASRRGNAMFLHLSV